MVSCFSLRRLGDFRCWKRFLDHCRGVAPGALPPGRGSCRGGILAVAGRTGRIPPRRPRPPLATGRRHVSPVLCLADPPVLGGTRKARAVGGARRPVRSRPGRGRRATPRAPSPLNEDGGATITEILEIMACAPRTSLLVAAGGFEPPTQRL